MFTFWVDLYEALLFLHWNTQVSHITMMTETILCSLLSQLKNGSLSTGIWRRSSIHTAQMFHWRAILPEPLASYRYLHLGPLWPAINLKIQSLNFVCVCVCARTINKFPICYFCVRRTGRNIDIFSPYFGIFPCFSPFLSSPGRWGIWGRVSVFAWWSGWTCRGHQSWLSIKSWH